MAPRLIAPGMRPLLPPLLPSARKQAPTVSGSIDEFSFAHPATDPRKSHVLPRSLVQYFHHSDFRFPRFVERVGVPLRLILSNQIFKSQPNATIGN